MLTGLLLLAVTCTGCASGLTGDPLIVAPDGATVRGQVISDAAGSVEYWVEYGPTRAYGSESAHATVSVQANAPTDVSSSVGGLARSMAYHYRLCAQDGSQRGGPGCGEDRRLVTQAVGCGETVAADVRLTGDLLCFGPGLKIGADGVAVNLAGHALRGSAGTGGGGPTGVDNSNGYDDVTVRNGWLTAWGTVFHAVGANRNRLVRVTGVGNGTGVSFEGGSDNEVRRGDVFGRSLGMSVNGSQRFVLADSEVSGAFSGVLALSADDARIVRNRFPRMGDEFPLATAMEVAGSRDLISANSVTGAWSDGGMLVAGADNRVVDNEVSGATRPDLSPPDDSLGNGIVINAFSAGVLLRGNRAHDNEGDGIKVLASGVRIGSNAADDNGDFGIDAVAGVTDLGGNTASGNGNPLQCRNVFCP